MKYYDNLLNQNLEKIGKPIVIASHPRSGTHLTIDLLRKQFRECQSWKHFGEPLDRLYLVIDALAASKKPLSKDVDLRIIQRSQRPIIKTHSSPNFIHLLNEHGSWIDWLKENADTYYILRDGRDVMCSLHLFMQSFDPTTRCSLSEFMRQKINGNSRPRRWANHVKHWRNTPGVQILHFEEIVRNTRRVIAQIGAELELDPLYVEPLLPERLASLWHSRAARLAQRQPESTAILGCYRGQKVQKWRKAFTASDYEFFHQEAGDLLIELGYETSEAWVET
ncbi:sulfotransferase domain-containing protein [Coleofasciculus sp. C1-SOL-03]|uniref:sulfotransferase domain-containing protein n=1 Tax=Coleofasciculus sp. C1-SOL-03 TaxID=3069522 RepID=UPI004063B2DB